MNIPDKIIKLIETFDYNLEMYKKGSYNETQVRREFIDPFFEELGWDIANKQGHAEAYKEVIHDEQIQAIFEAIRQLMMPPAKPHKKIGFVVKEKKAAYGKSTKESRRKK
ncbi:hypothetical protein C5S39_07160 [Candidatus Methanophagaceae archaeon]|nr:hypothetical protein C5S39_07160 [Methanophagales archaeon]